MKNGALHFDFTDNQGVRHTMILTSAQVMAWVDAVSRVASMLLLPATAAPKRIHAVKRSLDLLQTQHRGALFAIPEPRPFCVIRRTEPVLPFTVDIKRIRSIVEEQALGKSYEIELRIEQGTEGNRTTWEIPPDAISTSDFLLDAAWDRFRVNP